MREKVAVVGAGIVGIAHAWREAVHCADVTLFERNTQARGASVRNFGMVWPIGQRSEDLPIALAGRRLWKQFFSETGVWHNASGALFVAKHDDQWQVLHEFAGIAPNHGYDCELLDADATRLRCPAVTRKELRGGLLSKTEIGIDPREAISAAPSWLAEMHGVCLEFGRTVVEIDIPTLRTADGGTWEFDRVTIASGADFSTLYPDLFAANGFGKCKLQMMRTMAQPSGWQLGPRVATGLTLRHYPIVRDLPLRPIVARASRS